MMEKKRLLLPDSLLSDVPAAVHVQVDQVT
jgi:hypothetical protein